MPARRLAALTLGLLSLLAPGCAEPGPGHDLSEDLEADEASEERKDADPEGPTKLVVESLDWAVGDWWKWKVRAADAPEFEATTTVAKMEGADYVVGWGTVDEGLRAQFFHFIPHGKVSAKDGSWIAHGKPVVWQTFPLEDKTSWKGGLWLREMDFQAREAKIIGPKGEGSGFVIEGKDAEGDVAVKAEWGPDVKTFTHLEFFLFHDEPWLVLDLVDYGEGRVAPVQLLHDEASIIRGTELLYHVLSQTAPPVPEMVTVPAGVTHASIACYLGGSHGHYSVVLGTSGAGSYGCEVNNVGETGDPLQLQWGPISPGDHPLRMVTGGPGYAFFELYFVRAEEVVPQPA